MPNIINIDSASAVLHIFKRLFVFMDNQSVNWLSTIPIAHRGLHSGDGVIPENSLKSFSNAISRGYAIELDVQLLKDDNIIVFHDDTLLRMCSKNQRIDSLNLTDVKEFNLLNSTEQIPTFEEVLNLVKGQVPILIEIKNYKTKTGKLEKALLNILNKYEGNFAVQSFNPFSIIWFRKYAPAIIRGQLSGDFEDTQLPSVLKHILRNMYFNIWSKPNFIAYEKNSISTKFLQNRRKKGQILLCWTIKSLTEKVTLERYFDNLIFEGFYL